MFNRVRKKIGKYALISGVGLLLYQGFLFWRMGEWVPFPLAIVVERTVTFWGGVLAQVPMASPEGVETFENFRIGDLPPFLARFFRFTPISGVLIVVGSFLLRWKEYLGEK
ncbi:MAG: hypothetical protein V3V62_00825 [bacterium]